MSLGRVLVVEDDLELREALCDTLELEAYEVLQADSGESALALLNEQSAQLVVSDINMGGISGQELLVRLRALYPSLPVVLMTAYGDVASAVTAMRNGAADYLVKPFKPQALMEVVARQLGGKCNANAALPVAQEPSSQALLQLAQRVAVTDSTVLISGESGTGKEVLARFIHTHSARADGPFVAINCAAIPENMLEATLFGHEKGAFTGAYSSNAGKFEQANGGTLLLDEVSEMDLGLQAKLLRVLQEREVERVGGKKVIPLDVRIIATTNRDLLAHVAAGDFREDLYYRLSVFPLQWLPLRQRVADVVPLAERLIAQHCRKMGKQPLVLEVDAKAALQSHPWPGNVRELDNVIQRALILQQGTSIRGADLMLAPTQKGALVQALNPISAPQPMVEPAGALGDGMKHHEYQLIVDALTQERGRKNKAAEKLGISPRTLRYKMAKMRESGYDLDAALGF